MAAPTATWSLDDPPTDARRSWDVSDETPDVVEELKEGIEAWRAEYAR
jgi:hypothetical protein